MNKKYYNKKCKCGCQQYVKIGNTYINGHNSFNRIPWNFNLTKETDKRVNCISKTLLGTKASKETRNKMSISHKGCTPHNKGKTKENYKPLQLSSEKLKSLKIIPWNKNLTKETSEKIRIAAEKQKKTLNNPIWKETIGKDAYTRMGITKKEFYKKHPEKHANYIMGQKGFVSKPQKELFKIMKLFSNEAQLEYPLELENSTVFGDIVIPSEKLWIEYDGKHWHQDKEKDDIRQKKIEDKGFKVIRFDKERLKLLKEELNKDVNIRRWLNE